MRLPILCIAVLTLSASAAQAASVEVRDAVLRLTVIPEDRQDVKVEIVRPNPRLPLVVRAKGGRTTIEGKLSRDIGSCRSLGGKPSVQVRGVGEVAWAAMPQVVIRTPRDVVLAAGGAVFGAVGRSASLDLVNAGCGDWVIADVAGKLTLNQVGAGDTRAGSAARAKLRIAGAGDVAVRTIRSGAEIDIAGAGDVDVVSVSGPLDVRVAGSGDVEVERGRVGAFTVSVAGSGDVTFGGSAQSLKARVTGSGDVRAKAVRGAVDKRVAGSGTVTIG